MPTTDLTGIAGYTTGDYVSNFNRTSSACPHIAGVAALILPVNPNPVIIKKVIFKHNLKNKKGKYDYIYLHFYLIIILEGNTNVKQQLKNEQRWKLI